MAEEGIAGLCKPIQAGDVKKGQHIIMKGHPCRVMDVSKSKTGKHGHAKVNITGICVLTNKKYNDVQPAHAQLYTAEISKREFQLIGITEGQADLLDDQNQPYSVSLEGEIGEQLSKEYNPDDTDNDYLVTVLTAPTMEGDSLDKIAKKEVICAFKTAKAS